jgi:hypothetical protein
MAIRPGSPSFRRQASNSIAFVLIALATTPLLATDFNYTDSFGDPGLTLLQQAPDRVELSFSLDSWQLGTIDIDGQTRQTVNVPGMLLPNDAGAPNLPGQGWYIAVPRGAQVSLQIVAMQTETLTDIDLAPAPRLPLETEDGPLDYPINDAIYQRDAFYPEAPARLSDLQQIRGVATTVLGISPFQYNPVSKELIVCRDLQIEVTFQGGSGEFGETRLRSRWWDPLMEDLLVNFASLPKIDYQIPFGARDSGCEYLIICQDSPEFVAWADTLKRWRNEQGILTEVVTVAEIGGNTTSAIENYLNDAYQNWDIPPAAFLMLGDYGTGASGLITPFFAGHLASIASDNIYADVDADQLPDMVPARITARNEAELAGMIGKMLDYERQPPTDPGFYAHPIIAGGWQTERWFILCSEVLFGYFTNVHGKTPVREYAIYEGTPGSVWSSATNTATVVNYFGPSGLGYIPATPSHLNDWGGNASRLNNDMNSGAFILQHRDHGATSGWGEPSYQIGDLTGLHNDELTFVFSVNCLTGMYNMAGECFAEVFHRHAQGALGLIAATETSFSFVNDAYVWGMYDFMWPDFDPGYGVSGPANVKPAFGNTYGKYYLQASNWPYNSSYKADTYHLFHHHGDAFMTVCSELPEDLAVVHEPVLLSGVNFFTVTADEDALIGLSVAGELIGATTSHGAPIDITIPPLLPGDDFVVTVTKQNHYRYRQAVPVVSPAGPYLVQEAQVVHDADGDMDGMLDEGEQAQIEITLENVGSETATGINAALSSSDPYVWVAPRPNSFPDIPSGGFGTSLLPYPIEVAGDVPDGHTIMFTLSISATEGSWESNFALEVEAPVLVAQGLSVTDLIGDGNGGADSGETIDLQVLLANTGHSATDELTGTLTCADANVVVHQGSGGCASVLASGEGWIGSFAVEILPDCPSPSTLTLDLNITAANGFLADLDIELPVGGWFDTFETERGWTVGAPGDNATSGIWERVDPIGTEYEGHVIQMEDDYSPDAGTLCFVTGNGSVGGSAGENDVDNGKTTLLTPVFDLSDALSATISYYRWYTNSWGSSPDQDWWAVDVTSDGVNWISLEYTQQTLAEWTQFTFELTDYISLTDQVQVRFVARDDSPGSLVEAGVDDFLLTVDRGILSGATEDVAGLPMELTLIGNSPNPFNPKTVIGFDLPQAGQVELAVYDISGRKVSTLVSDQLGPGHHEVTWLGVDRHGRRVASGVYFSVLSFGGERRVDKLMLVK